jgi:hypothetical protein
VQVDPTSGEPLREFGRRNRAGEIAGECRSCQTGTAMNPLREEDSQPRGPVHFWNLARSHWGANTVAGRAMQRIALVEVSARSG